MEYKELVKYVAEAIRGNEEEIALSIKYIGMRYPFSDTVIADTVCDAIYEVGEGLIDVWSEYNKDEEEVFFDALDYLESEGGKKSEVVAKLEGLVHKRFHLDSLRKALEDIFGEEVHLSPSDVEADELIGDECLTFYIGESYGVFDIYYLPLVRADYSGNTLYVTEVGYAFGC